MARMVATDPGGCSSVSLAVMCSYGPDKLLLVPLNETCSPQTILILPICYCPMCPIQWDRVQLNWTWFFSRWVASSHRHSLSLGVLRYANGRVRYIKSWCAHMRVLAAVARVGRALVARGATVR